MEYPVFEIDLPLNGAQGKVRLNGKTLDTVTDIKIEAGVDRLTKVTLSLLAEVKGKIHCEKLTLVGEQDPASPT